MQWRRWICGRECRQRNGQVKRKDFLSEENANSKII